MTKTRMAVFLIGSFLGLTLGACQSRQGAHVDWFSGKDVALQRAIDQDDPALLNQAVQQGANVNAHGRTGVTPLQYAIGHFRVRTFDALLQHKADPNQRDDEKDNAVTLAQRAFGKDPHYLNAVLDAGGDPNTRDPSGDPILVNFLPLSDVKGIELLQQYHANMNAEQRDGIPVVLMAAQNQYWISAWTLLSLGADYKVRSQQLGTIADAFRNSEILARGSHMDDSRRKCWEFLHAHGVQLPPLLLGSNSRSFKTYADSDSVKRFFLPAALVALALCLFLVRKGGFMTHSKAAGIAQEAFPTPQLLQAAKAFAAEDRTAIANLKRSGFNMNQEETANVANEGIFSGLTLLTWAVVARDEVLVNRVLDEGADPNYVPKHSMTALGWAASLEDPSLMLLLLKRGANPNLYGTSGYPAIFDAASSERWNNVYTLLDHGADVNAIDRSTGDTLGIRSVTGHTDQTLKLLQRGLDPTHLDYQGAGIAHQLQWDGSNPTLPNEKYRQQLRANLLSKGIKLDVPRYGPPPRSEWPASQANDPHLIEAEKEAARYGFR